MKSVVSEYVKALDTHAGERLCSLFAPGALNELKLPVQAGGCAASVAASLGYRDPRGFPVWQHSQVRRFRSVNVDRETAGVTVTVETRYADRPQPSVEDDVVYLERRGGKWLIVKPSVTIYRAIGVPNAPPQVLAPPTD